MLSIKPLDSAKDSHDYYMKAVAYYQSDSTATQWLGSGKSYLNLEGSIDSATFLSLLQGHLPNGQKLQNPQGEHRPGVDMTFSAPKSVSILVGLGAAPELMQFHDDAVKHAISHLKILVQCLKKNYLLFSAEPIQIIFLKLMQLKHACMLLLKL